MNILLTNDDGYGTVGLNILKLALQKYGNVYTFAPTYHQSGASMSFSIFKGFTITKYSEFDYSCDGTPVDCVLIGIQMLKDVKFDLVVSGCNNGLNISYDTLYSGTIGATIEAINHQIPAIAFSTDMNHFDIVEAEIDNVVKKVIEEKIYSNKYVLNINFPSNKFNESIGIKITREVFKNDHFFIWHENNKIYTDRDENLESDDEESDVYAINHGYISICPIKNSLFDLDTFNKLKKSFR